MTAVPHPITSDGTKFEQLAGKFSEKALIREESLDVSQESRIST
jgi:hypothetical protein